MSAGRLDLASTGLLLLTTDTMLANWVTDPDNGVLRRYVVTVRGLVNDEEARKAEQGIGPLHAERVVVQKQSSRESHLLVDLSEGRNREVRRLMEGIGHEVTRLKRVSFGGLSLGGLAPGEWREVPREEITSAFRGVRMSAPGVSRS